MGKQRKNGKAKTIADKGPFGQFRRAVLALGSATTTQQKHSRSKRVFEMLEGFEASFWRSNEQVSRAYAVLLHVSGGEFLTFRTDRHLSHGATVRVEDAKGDALPILDLYNGRVLRLPRHVPPYSLVITSADGTVHRNTPDQQPEPQASDEAVEA
jgi:hypothetical protein